MVLAQSHHPQPVLVGWPGSCRPVVGGTYTLIDRFEQCVKSTTSMVSKVELKLKSYLTRSLKSGHMDKISETPLVIF